MRKLAPMAHNFHILFHAHFFCLQLGNPAPPPVAIMLLATDLTGQSSVDGPFPLIKRVLRRQQQQHKTHDVSSSDLAGSLLCSLICPEYTSP